MAKTTILSEQELTFSEDSSIGLFFWNSELIFTLIAGETYTVVWNEQEFSCIAEEMELDGLAGIGLGNKAIVGIGDDTEEPFIFAYLSDLSMNACYSTSTETTHTVAIYQGEEETSSAGVILKDRNGADIEYPNIKTVKLRTADGGTKDFIATKLVETNIDLDFSNGDMAISSGDDKSFSKVTIPKPSALVPENIREGVEIAGVMGETVVNTEEDLSVELDFTEGNMEITPDEGKAFSKVSISQPESLAPENILEGVDIAGVKGSVALDVKEELPVTLDFSSGDMEITADEGKAFSKVSIPQPETLIPANIAEGVNIAGIIGALAAGGGGGDIKIVSGTTTGTGKPNLAISALTITHDLGVMPDLFFAYTNGYPATSSSSEYNYMSCLGMSEKLGQMLGIEYLQMFAMARKKSSYYDINPTRIDTPITGTNLMWFNAANESTIQIGNNSRYFAANATITWLAIGGLT